MPNPLFESQLSSLSLVQRGKVRDIYAIDDKYILIVASDRISAFDVILPTPIPNKGKILTTVSNFWFHFSSKLIQNHLVEEIALADILPNIEERQQIEDRAVVVRKLKPLPIEAIVRGYIAGSGWKDYQRTGQICGIHIPKNLQLASKLDQPIFTPSTKALQGLHDENIDFSKVVELIGKPLAEQMRQISLEIYTWARDYAAERGIIIADTKFEFGVDDSGQLHLIDEVLTPDSSRFWPTNQYQEGINPPSFDKQFVRDYLETLDWDKTPPAPELPKDIITKTAAKYHEAEQRLTMPKL